MVPNIVVHPPISQYSQFLQVCPGIAQMVLQEKVVNIAVNTIAVLLVLLLVPCPALLEIRLGQRIVMVLVDELFFVTNI